MKSNISFACVVSALVAILLVVLAAGLVHASERGEASYYDCCTTTANGERFRTGALTAAHKTLPFGTCVQVTNLKNKKTVIVRINDRGPFIRGRIIDLTPAGKSRLGMGGTAPVSVTVVGKNRC